MQNGFFQRMCRDAAEDLASGDKGWKEVETNVLVLACFHFLTNHLAHTLSRPLWFFSSAVAVGVIGYIIHLVLG